MSKATAEGINDPTNALPWRCAGCGKWYVVQSLARRCEAKHERDADGSTG